MRYCVVKDCFSWKQKNEKTKYFKFPRNPEIRKKWISVCGKEDINYKTGRVCSQHFTDSDWRLKDILLNTPIEKRLLDPSAVPTINIHKNGLSIDKKSRAMKKANKKIVEILTGSDSSFKKEEFLEAEFLESSEDENDIDDEQIKCSFSVQKEVEDEFAKDQKIKELESKLEELKNETIKLTCENEQLRNLENSLQNIFTSGQIKKLKNPKKKVNWNLEDISAALSLYSAGPRAYRYLYSKQFPLPRTSTLKECVKKIEKTTQEDN